MGEKDPVQDNWILPKPICIYSFRTKLFGQQCIFNDALWKSTGTAFYTVTLEHYLINSRSLIHVNFSISLHIKM